MNLVDCYVTKVLSEPEFIDLFANEGITWWQVTVEYNSYGVQSTTKLTFDSQKEAAAVEVGHHFLV